MSSSLIEVLSHSLCAVDFSVCDGADKRHYFAIVEKETDKRNGGFLFFPTHLPQDMSGGRRHRLSWDKRE